MTARSMKLFKSAAKGLFSGELSGLVTADLSAHLLNPAANPLVEQHQVLADLNLFEVKATGMQTPALTGLQMRDEVDGEVHFVTDPVFFGSPVTLSPFRYLVIAYGHPKQAPALKPLLAYADLSADGGALEVIRSSLVFDTGIQGWFSLSY